MIINPWSENNWWKLSTAREIANRWYRWMQEVYLDPISMEYIWSEDWLFVFKFTHSVTWVVRELRTHWRTNEEARELFVFTPRIYWNGSSTWGYWPEESWNFSDKWDERELKVSYVKKQNES